MSRSRNAGVMDAHWVRFVVWAMLPLTLIGVRPFTGCICATGQFKVLCPLTLQCGYASTTTIADSRLCVCCKPATSSAQRNACCRAAADAPTDPPVADHSVGSSGGQDGCCTIIASSSAVGDPAMQAASAGEAPYFWAVAIVSDSVELPPSRRPQPAWSDQRSPPRDFVIAFQRLTI
jgi:hypothetical protein